MRLTLFIAGLALTVSLGACVNKDTLVHGPFLIGPEQPYRYTGSCCVPGRIYSQNARQDWTACSTAGVACRNAEDLVPDRRDTGDLKGPPRRRPLARPETSRRSAWED